MEATTAPTPAYVRRESLGRRLWDWVREHAINIYAALAIAYLLIPIAVIIWFSFNNPAGKYNFTWEGFTLYHWEHVFSLPDLNSALVTSLQLALYATLISTAIGTLMALALVRYQFRGRAPTNFFIFLPLASPEIVLGASLLSMFLNLGVALGFGTILIAHIMFNVSFVVVTVRSRLIGFDRSVEEAAQDLGANSVQTFLRVTLPLIFPAVLAAGLLAFALSIDDFVITNFNNGSTITFPLFIWGAARVAVPPQINVIAAMIFLVTVFAMILTVWQQRRAEKLASVRPEPEPVA